MSGFFRKLLRFTSWKTMLSFTILFHDASADDAVVLTVHRPFTWFRSVVTVKDAAGKEVGTFRQKLLAIGPKMFILDPTGRRDRHVKGNWIGWNLQIVDDAEKVLGTITKKWAGVGKELFTSADNYVIDLSDEVKDPDAAPDAVRRRDHRGHGLQGVPLSAGAGNARPRRGGGATPGREREHGVERLRPALRAPPRGRSLPRHEPPEQPLPLLRRLRRRDDDSCTDAEEYMRRSLNPGDKAAIPRRRSEPLAARLPRAPGGRVRHPSAGGAPSYFAFIQRAWRMPRGFVSLSRNFWLGYVPNTRNRPTFASAQ